MAEVKIPTVRGEMPAYLATPPGARPWPGVVVIHDVVGMGSDLRNQADWLASEGYLAVAPDLFYWGRKMTCLRTIFRDLADSAGKDIRRDRGCAHLAGGTRWLQRQDRCHRLLHGRRIRLAACSRPRVLGVERQLRRGPERRRPLPGRGLSHRRKLWREGPDVARGRKPVGAGTFGGGSGPRREGVSRRRTLVPQQPQPADVSTVFVVMAKLTGAAYHEPSAQDARRRIVAFFNAHLKP